MSKILLFDRILTLNVEEEKHGLINNIIYAK